MYNVCFDTEGIKTIGFSTKGQARKFTELLKTGGIESTCHQSKEVDLTPKPKKESSPEKKPKKQSKKQSKSGNTENSDHPVITNNSPKIPDTNAGDTSGKS